MAPMEGPRAHIALLPGSGMGHLNPFAALAKQLVHRHNLSVTIILLPFSGPPPHKAEMEVLEALPETVNHVFLPQPVSLLEGDSGKNIGARIFLTVARSLSSLRETLVSLMTERTHRLVALVVDPFCTDAFEVAEELHVSPYLFFPTTAECLLFSLYLPKLDRIVAGQFTELTEPIKLPGCSPVHGGDLVESVKDRSSEFYKMFLQHVKRFPLAQGILLNSFHDLEPGAIKALQLQTEPGWPPVYPVGPLIQTKGSHIWGSDRPECLQWLDTQPSGSVLFVAFGSGGVLSHDQLIELAYGLEMSGQRFLWVVRSPNNKSSDAAFFSGQSQNDDPFGFLPKGFLDRTKGNGLVVCSWAPQIEVLAHGSIGGFITHCGWNSSLESIVHGVPLITWPLYAEQKMNAKMLSEDIKVALRPRVSDENGIVDREEIARVVKSLMEGEEGEIIRNRMKILKEASKNVLSQDGSSMKSLSELATKWKNLKTM